MQKLQNTTNPKLKALMEETINKKYKIFAVEGFYAPIVDYAAYDVYRKYLTQEMNDFIDIKLDESTQPAVLDAGIVIPIDDFIGRILKSFKYLDNYPDSPRFAKVKQFNDGRIMVYLSGIDNTPVFDINNKIYPEKLQEFKENADKYAGTEFGNILKSYLDLLVQENYTRTAKVDDFLQKFSS